MEDGFRKTMEAKLEKVQELIELTKKQTDEVFTAEKEKSLQLRGEIEMDIHKIR